MIKFAISSLLLCLSLTACQSQSKAPRDDDESSSLCAQQENIMCTMEFAPAVCEIRVGALSGKATGSNTCVARKILLRQLCNAGNRVTQEQLDSARCVRE